MTSREASIQELKNLKGKPLKAKIAYILTYYWVPILLVPLVVFVFASTIRSIFLSPREVLCGYCLNASANSMSTVDLESDYITGEGLDPKKSTVLILTGVRLEASEDGTIYASEASQALSYRVSAMQLDFVAANPEIFEAVALSGGFADLSQVLTPQQMAEYAQDFVYMERQTLEAIYLEDPGSAERKPMGSAEGMEDPVPIGVRLPADSALKDRYVFDGEEVLYGVVSNSMRPQAATAFLTYIMK